MSHQEFGPVVHEHSLTAVLFDHAYHRRLTRQLTYDSCPQTRSAFFFGTMDTFNEIHAQLSTVPYLCDSIGMEKGMEFVRLAARLKAAILTAQAPSHDAQDPPAQLPDFIGSFLGSALGIPMDYVDGCWKAFSNVIWTCDDNGKTKGSDAEAFKRHGLDDLLGSLSLSTLCLPFPDFVLSCKDALSPHTLLHHFRLHQHRPAS